MAVTKKKTYNVKPTQKQKRLAANLVEKGSTKKKAMIDAGYSPRSAVHPSTTLETKGFQLAAEPYVEQLKRARAEAIAEIRIKDLNTVQYSDLSNAISKMTQQVELLEGRSTENHSVEFKWSE